jgi:hypothetical protein
MDLVYVIPATAPGWLRADLVLRKSEVAASEGMAWSMLDVAGGGRKETPGYRDPRRIS